MPFELGALQARGLLFLAAGILSSLVAAGWVLRAVRWRRRHRMEARQRRARRGEEDAAELLERLGFTVLEQQATARWELRIGDRGVEVSSRADLIVERRGTRFVADVKTGGQVPDPRHPATRRQLLEYLHAFDVDGALLVDMEGQTIVEVTFPGLIACHAPSGSSGRWTRRR